MTMLQNAIVVLGLVVGTYEGAIAQTAPFPPQPVPPSVLPSAAVEPSQVVQPPPPLVVRVEQVAPIKLEPSGDSSWWTRLVPIIAPIISGLIALGGVWLGLRVGQSNTQRTIDAAQLNSEAAINQKANESELKEIQEKFDAFYGPYLQRSEENRLLALELRDRQPDRATFRTLLKLLDPAWFAGLSKADQTIVNEIVGNGVELRTLIRDKAGAVDSAVLPYLARAGTHFTILKLAKEGALNNDPGRFERYVYPAQLDAVLSADMTRLKRRSQTLQTRPSERHGPLDPLVIPPELALPVWPEPPPRY
jgi:hypothetical protein